VTCAQCGTPTRDNAYTCEDCLSNLAHIIGSAPQLEIALTHDLVGERSPRLESGSRSTEPPLPFDIKAGELLDELRNKLTCLVRLCWEEGVRHQSPDRGLPTSVDTPATIGDMSTWLLWRVDGMAWVEWSGEIVRQFKALDRRIYHYLKPREPKVFLGVCEQILTLETRVVKCGGFIYAARGEQWGKCDRADCCALYDTETQRSTLETILDSRLYTAADIAKLSTYLGLDLGTKGRETVRRKVHYWARHGRIVSIVKEPETGNPMYRYGEVKALLYGEFARSS
jgi:hypothetical protein